MHTQLIFLKFPLQSYEATLHLLVWLLDYEVQVEKGLVIVVGCHKHIELRAIPYFQTSNLKSCNRLSSDLQMMAGLWNRMPLE